VIDPGIGVHGRDAMHTSLVPPAPRFQLRTVLHWATFLVTTAYALPTRAEPPEPKPRAAPVRHQRQVVWLRVGAVARGELVELVPGDHVTLLLATGEVRKYAWADVAQTTAESQPESAPPAPTTADDDASQVAASKPEGPLVRLVVRADSKQATVERRVENLHSDSGEEVVVWKLVCSVPCDLMVPAGYDYRLAGAGLVASDIFRPTPGSPYDLRATMASRATENLWRNLSIAGVASLASGTLFLAYAAKSQDEGAASWMKGPGYAFIGLGTVALAVSVPLFLSNRTRVKTAAGEPVATSRDPKWAGVSWTAQGIRF
jgi:hypothetical protein